MPDFPPFWFLRNSDIAKNIYKQTGMNVEAIRSHIIGWLELEYEPKGLDDEQMELFESQINAWIDDYGNSLIK